MTRLFLAAGVAALAIAMPASAKPGDGDRGGKGGGQSAAAANHGGGGGGKARAHAGGGRGGGEVRADFGRGGGKMRSAERKRGGFEGQRAQRQAFAFDRGKDRRGAVQIERGQGRFERLTGGDRRAERRDDRARKFERAQQRRAERRDIRLERMRHVEKRSFGRDRIRDDDRFVLRDQIRPERLIRVGTRDWDDRDRWDRGHSRGFIEGCPPGLWMKGNGCLPPGQAKKLFGQPLATAARLAALNELPFGMRAFYPDSDDYYYRYGDGYLYRVDRTSNLISSLLPLIGGGYVPGMMFPTSYSPFYQTGATFPNYYGNSYVPDYYGFNAFYPDTPYVDYRYLNGNIYGVDPYSGLIEDVIPTYAYGYGVGQVMPAGYGYYNVPMDYRSLYYDTPDYSYRYAPGAIYQVDPTSQLITAVASLLAPGLSIGQQLPMGYDVYNVPYSYRQTYYDTPDAWYRYNNGNIYQIDPTTRLVTAIVASLLT